MYKKENVPKDPREHTKDTREGSIQKGKQGVKASIMI